MELPLNRQGKVDKRNLLLSLLRDGVSKEKLLAKANDRLYSYSFEQRQGVEINRFDIRNATRIFNGTYSREAKPQQESTTVEKHLWKDKASKSGIITPLVVAAMAKEGRKFDKHHLLAEATKELIANYSNSERQGVTFTRNDIDRAMLELKKAGKTKEKWDTPYLPINGRGKVNKLQLLMNIIEEELNAGREIDCKKTLLIAEKRLEQYKSQQRAGVKLSVKDYSNASNYVRNRQGKVGQALTPTVAPSAAQTTAPTKEQEYPVIMEELLAAKTLLSVCHGDSEKASYLIQMVSQLQGI